MWWGVVVVVLVRSMVLCGGGYRVGAWWSADVFGGVRTAAVVCGVSNQYWCPVVFKMLTSVMHVSGRMSKSRRLA